MVSHTNLSKEKNFHTLFFLLFEICMHVSCLDFLSCCCFKKNDSMVTLDVF